MSVSRMTTSDELVERTVGALRRAASDETLHLAVGDDITYHVDLRAEGGGPLASVIVTTSPAYTSPRLSGRSWAVAVARRLGVRADADRLG